MKRTIWDAPLLRSRTSKTKVILPEMLFGYFLGPLLVLLPLVSILPMALSNIIVGILMGEPMPEVFTTGWDGEVATTATR